MSEEGSDFSDEVNVDLNKLLIPSQKNTDCTSKSKSPIF